MARLPKPTALKILEGERADRINFNEPKSPDGLGEPPDYLEGYALDCWNEMKETLEGMKVATQADRHAIAIYCTAYERWRESLLIIKFGRVVPVVKNVEFNQYGEPRDEEIDEKMVDSGYVIQRIGYDEESKYLKIAERAEDKLITLGRYFGLNPVARASIHVTAKNETDELAQYTQRQIAKESRSKAEKA